MLEGMLETALYARDLDKAETFYEDVLGLEKIARAANRHVFFRCGPGVLLIFNPDETVKPPAPKRCRCRRTARPARAMPVFGYPAAISMPWPNG